MGFKRPFNDDEIHGLTFKQTRAPSYDKPLHFIETFPLSNSQKEEELVEIDDLGVEIYHTSSLEKNEDSYSFQLYRAPRKKVAIGLDFQAPILSREDEFGHSRANVLEFGGNRYMGSCVIPMPEPETESNGDPEVGIGRKRCGCSDADSVRCVRQHIMEAREKLRVSIGHENFVDLGFYEMGEEVACHWSEDDERVFNRVVYSNPSSLGLNFWRRLAEAFPTRSKKEIVSYYFNVFMLRKRATQNRSSAEIDSDDDEFHGVVRNPGNPRIESVVVIDSSDDSDGDEPNDGDVVSDETGEDSGIDSGLDLYELNVCDSGKRGSAGGAPIEEDSCVSFEFSTKVDAGGSVNDSHQKRVPSLFLFDACDSKLWDSQCTRNVKGVDFLPTSNIIDEIFGKENCNLPDHGINH